MEKLYLLLSIILFWNLQLIGQIPANDNCDQATLLTCGSITTGSTLTATFTDNNNGCGREDEEDVWYSFIGTGQFTQTEFISSSAANISFDILTNTCTVNNTCVDQFRRIDQFSSVEETSFFAESGESYFIRVTTNDPGDFSFQLNCIDTAQNDLCENAQSISCGENIVGSLEFARITSIQNTGCFTSSFDADVWYTVIGNDEIISLSFSRFIDIRIIESDCNSTDNNCIFGGRSTNRAIFLGDLGQEYLILISDGNNSEFSFDVNCSTPIINDNCENAIELTCDDVITGSSEFLTAAPQSTCFPEGPDLWYRISGDGNTWKLTYINSSSDFMTFAILETDDCSEALVECGEDRSLAPGQEVFNINTVSGNDFLIRLVPNEERNPDQEFSFSVSCVDEPVNDQCINAIPIECNIPIIGSISNATSISEFNGCSSLFDPDIWYTFAGDGSILDFSLLDNEGQDLFLEIYNEPCSQSYFNCFESIQFDSNSSNTFATTAGIQYWFRMYGTATANFEDFTLTMECRELEPNNSCENAIQLICGESYIGDTNNATSLGSVAGCLATNGRPNLWYSIIGDGNVYRLEYIQSENTSSQFEIRRGTCAQSFFCLDFFTLSMNSPIFEFYAAPGDILLIHRFDRIEDAGELQFNVSCPAPISGDLCEDAIEFACGDTVNGSTSGATFQAKSGCFESTNNDIWHTFIGDGSTVEFSYISSQDNTNIRIDQFLDACDISSSNCISSNTIGRFDNGTLIFPTEAGRIYYLRLDLGSTSGSYSFDVTCIEAIPNDDCQNAEAISCGQTVSATTLGATFSNAIPSCFGGDGADLWYTIIGEGNTIQFIYQTSDTDNISLEVNANMCDANNVDCDATFILTPTELSSTFFADNGVTYTIRVSNTLFGNGVGDFTFSLECLDPPANDSCEDAQDMSCAETITGSTAAANSLNSFDGCKNVWYRITGDGAIHEFEFLSSSQNFISFLLYEENCPVGFNEEIENLFVDQSSIFSRPVFLENGVNYFVRVRTDCDQGGDFSFSHNCRDGFENDFCDDAIPIICGEPYTASFLNATLSDNLDMESCNNFFGSNLVDIWYTISGDGMIYRFLGGDNFFVQVNIIEDVCNENNITCSNTISINESRFDSNSFFAEQGQDYLIRLFGDAFNQNEFTFEIECVEPASNDLCDNAEEINCGSVIDLDFSIASGTRFTNACFTASPNTLDLWYSIIGTGEFITLSTQDQSSEFFSSIYSTNCSNLSEVCPQDLNAFSDDAVFLERDSFYLLRISGNKDVQTTAVLNCLGSADNDDCTNPLPLACGETIQANSNTATSTMEFNGCRTEFENDIWYTINGTDEIVEFEFLQSDIGNLTIQVFDGDCNLETTNCINDFFLDIRNSQEATAQFLASSGTTYLIRVAAEEGDFSLDINCIRPAINNSCEGSMTVECGDTIEGNTSLATPDTFCNGGNQSFMDGHTLWCFLEGDGMIYNVELNLAPSFSVNGILYSEMCPEDCNSEETFFRVDNSEPGRFQALEGVDYYISFSTEDDELGPFSVTLTCNEPPANDTCETAEEINCDQLVTGSTAFASDSSNFGEPDVWYSFVGTGEVLEFDFVSSPSNSFNLSLLILENSCDFDASVRGLNIRQNNPRFFQTELGVTYYIQTTIPSLGSFGEFSFQFNCVEPLINDNCEAATEIMCGSTISDNNATATFSGEFNGCVFEQEGDLWYTILGTNDVYQFNFINSHSGEILFELYQEPCFDENLICLEQVELNSFRNYNIFLVENQQYYFRVYTDQFSGIGGQYSFYVSCIESVENDICENAEIILCGQTVTGSTRSATASNDLTLCIFNDNTPDIWYTLQGTGDVWEFNYLSSTTNTILLNVYSIGSCDNVSQDCPDFLNLNINNLNNTFLTDPAITYFIRATSGNDNDDVSDFSFEIACLDPPENDLCENAIPINCNSEITGSFDLASSLTVFCNNSFGTNPAVWYSFQSTGNEVYQFTLEGDFDASLVVYDGGCGVLNCVASVEDRNFGETLILTRILPEGDYLLLVTSTDFSRDNFTLTFDCTEPRVNDNCSEAIELVCGSIITDSLSGSTGLGPNSICTGSPLPEGIWYSFTGTGASLELSIQVETNTTELSITRGSCDNPICIETIRVSESFILNSVEGENYLFYVADRFDADANFTLEVNCDFFFPSDPCSCNNDQSANGAMDGRFDETIVIEDNNFFSTWTVVEISSSIEEKAPTEITVGQELIYRNDQGIHEISFEHIDGSGYQIDIAGPFDLGDSRNDTVSVSNICNYPTLDSTLFLAPIPFGTTLLANEVAEEINGYTGDFSLFINGEQASEINTSELGIGIHQLRLEFNGDFVSNTTSDFTVPANPGCTTFIEGQFEIEDISAIPTTSEWGLFCLSLLLLIVATNKLKSEDHTKQAAHY